MSNPDAGRPAAGRAGIIDERDLEVVERVRAGDTGAYELVMRRYNQRLFRIARSILRDDAAAEDAVQEAYVRAYYHLQSYAPTGSFAAWLARITVNEALMMKRRSSRTIEDNEAVAGARADSRYEPAEIVANGELAGVLEAAIDRLPADFRTVFVLRGVERLSVAETANHLDIPEATVKTRYHRARKLMQGALSRRFAADGMHAFEFAGHRCDRLCAAVIRRIEDPAGVRRAMPNDQAAQVPTAPVA